ncbi:MAG: LptF/LptG family permease [Candidatus Eisenbacteria sp.]|nr:LptF/LptG family permease [Candidatus Eisenbacteria bacterium]
MLRILDKHVLREFLLYVLLGISTFVGLYLIVDLFEKIDTFVDHRASAELILAYYLYSLPVIVIQVLPIAMLLAAILAFGQLRKFNEITAMQSCGISPLRISAPVLVLAAVITLGAFAVAEGVVPDAYRHREQTIEVKIKKKRPPESLGRSNIHYMGRGGRIYVAKQFDPRRPELSEVSIQFFLSDSSGPRMWKRIDASRARWRDDGMLHVENGYLRTFEGNTERLAAFRRYGDSRMEERPEEFLRVENDPFLMSRRELSNYIHRIREGGARVHKYLVDYHLRAAFPFANFVMVLLGTCLSLRVLRGTVALGFGISLSLGFAYYGFLRVGQALGYTGYLPPLLSAWLGNIFFGAIGTFLFWKSNR